MVVNEWPMNADPLWGPALGWHTGYAVDDEVRHQGSSGGVITALAIHLLENGNVDGVVQMAASEVDPLRSRSTLSQSRAGILASAGSRYAPSASLLPIGDLLAGTGRRLAFIGKPCEVSALRQLARVDARVNERFPVMLSFFCAGIPSQTGTDRIIRHLGLENAEITSFRYRGEGWPGTAKAVANDGRVGAMTYAESWGNILSKEQQFRCKLCPDGIGGSADLACADAWYGDDKGYPDFSETDGRSLVIPRTETGRVLLESAIAAGAVEVAPLDKRDIERMQPAQARRRRELLARNAALVVTGRHRVTMRNLFLAEAAAQISIMHRIKTFLSTLRRVLTGRV